MIKYAEMRLVENYREFKYHHNLLGPQKTVSIFLGVKPAVFICGAASYTHFTPVPPTFASAGRGAPAAWPNPCDLRPLRNGGSSGQRLVSCDMLSNFLTPPSIPVRVFGFWRSVGWLFNQWNALFPVPCRGVITGGGAGSFGGRSLLANVGADRGIRTGSILIGMPELMSRFDGGGCGALRNFPSGISSVCVP